MIIPAGGQVPVGKGSNDFRSPCLISDHFSSVVCRSGKSRWTRKVVYWALAEVRQEMKKVGLIHRGYATFILSHCNLCTDQFRKFWKQYKSLFNRGRMSTHIKAIYGLGIFSKELGSLSTVRHHVEKMHFFLISKTVCRLLTVFRFDRVLGTGRENYSRVWIQQTSNQLTVPGIH